MGQQSALFDLVMVCGLLLLAGLHAVPTLTWALLKRRAAPVALVWVLPVVLGLVVLALWDVRLYLPLGWASLSLASASAVWLVHRRERGPRGARPRVWVAFVVTSMVLGIVPWVGPSPPGATAAWFCGWACLLLDGLEGEDAASARTAAGGTTLLACVVVALGAVVDPDAGGPQSLPAAGAVLLYGIAVGLPAARHGLLRAARSLKVELAAATVTAILLVSALLRPQVEPVLIELWLRRAGLWETLPMVPVSEYQTTPLCFRLRAGGHATSIVSWRTDPNGWWCATPIPAQEPLWSPWTDEVSLMARTEDSSWWPPADRARIVQVLSNQPAAQPISLRSPDLGTVVLPGGEVLPLGPELDEALTELVMMNGGVLVLDGGEETWTAGEAARVCAVESCIVGAR